ncbi:MAG: DUF3500 domain-containing protein [Pseudomonadota bacterium]
MSDFADYRPHLPGPEQSRIAGHDAHSHAVGRLALPRAAKLFAEWAEVAKAPFSGITTDGKVRQGLFHLADEGAPAESMARAGWALLDALDPIERRRCQLALGNSQQKAWQNTEIWAEHDGNGLRLDQATDTNRDLVLNIVRYSLSDRGYANTIGAMQLNGFLGDLLDAKGVLSEWSYNFCIYGVPSTTEPWGWQLWGHHLCINCMNIGGQMVLTPSFVGAEICYADQGRFNGLRLFQDEERRGLQLMNSLSCAQQAKARLGWSLAGDDLPEGRVHFADYLMLGGAYQDNRIVPFEGIAATQFDRSARTALFDLVEAYIGQMPEGPRQAKMAQFEDHLPNTNFCWIGGNGPSDPFYYRVQSPVVFIEFDHHPGLFLTNNEALKFHVHTVVRTPNGNDYGVDLLRQHYRDRHLKRDSHSTP